MGFIRTNPRIRKAPIPKDASHVKLIEPKFWKWTINDSGCLLRG